MGMEGALAPWAPNRLSGARRRDPTQDSGPKCKSLFAGKELRVAVWLYVAAFAQSNPCPLEPTRMRTPFSNQSSFHIDGCPSFRPNRRGTRPFADAHRVGTLQIFRHCRE